MRVFAVLGSAPLGADRLSLLECGQQDVMLSFFDYGHSYQSLLTLTQQYKEKHHDYVPGNRRQSLRDRADGRRGTIGSDLLS